MVLVCVTTFKGHHKIQDRWENREYVVEKQPYPNVPIYVVCPRDGEGCSQTLHRNYLLPISPTIQQDKKDAPMAGAENTKTPTPAPPMDSEAADAGPSGMVTPSTAGNTPQGSQINLLHLHTAPKKLRTDSQGGTRISVYRQIPGHPTSGMHRLVFRSYQVCTMLPGEVQCECALCIPSHVCKSLLILALREIPFM